MSDMSLFLQAGDFVGVSFWIVSVAMVAATVFFFYEGMAVNKEWRLSMTVAGLVTLVAAIHYYYMRDYWVASVIAGAPDSPIVYRYIDWLITVHCN
jgi:sensory rhodopsin